MGNSASDPSKRFFQDHCDCANPFYFAIVIESSARYRRGG
jgi:hypothetical protein